ncbi:hypothetical protein FQA47_017483 [Oryzias melastigma]|uniref:Uncharacterized protein n=1 Tax=Oryzias melastigma TaxID=30732 RepID=A0A834KY54_ORYME|nr:hypothetical protein FQA47_017483 [Oryzias melastigma]
MRASCGWRRRITAATSPGESHEPRPADRQGQRAKLRKCDEVQDRDGDGGMCGGTRARRATPTRWSRLPGFWGSGMSACLYRDSYQRVFLCCFKDLSACLFIPFYDLTPPSTIAILPQVEQKRRRATEWLSLETLAEVVSSEEEEEEEEEDTMRVKVVQSHKEKFSLRKSCQLINCTDLFHVLTREEASGGMMHLNV